MAWRKTRIGEDDGAVELTMVIERKRGREDEIGTDTMVCLHGSRHVALARVVRKAEANIKHTWACLRFRGRLHMPMLFLGSGDSMIDLAFNGVAV